MGGVPQVDAGATAGFQRIVAGFLAQPGLPFAGILSGARVFARHGNLFGVGQIYSTAVMVWSFLGQVLRDEKEASCQAAVARIVTYFQEHGSTPPTSDTGDYCRARVKLSEAALHDLSVEVAAELEAQADPRWLWKGRHAQLVDGTTITMPDTTDNQREYPAPRSQTPGVGLPIARITAVLSLATACVSDLAVGPYAGKETGETALLRQLLNSFQPGNVAVMDRYYCSFLMIALLCSRGIDVCTRMHQRRHVDFRRGRKLGYYDHLITWTRPARPAWMDEATYALIPETPTLREMSYRVVQPGCRTKSIVLATTLTDPAAYTREDLAELYGFRWNSELDLRAMKQSLNLDHVRCKTPAMVRKELWTTVLAYNLIRTTAAAALLHEKQPRQMSFTAACQYVLANWMLIACEVSNPERALARCQRMLAQIAACEVANRPGRLEPRVLKRRRHRYKLMQQPRTTLRNQMDDE